MVARINTGKNISKALNYNEQKLQQGRAEILHASGFIKDAKQLNFYDKISQFNRNISLNEKATTNTLHVSLNFDPNEKLSDTKLTEIATSYMDKIGFGHQPYLVYRHHDAGHPHIHIVSTNIQQDGKRISMHNLGKDKSEPARKEIEVEFGLIRAGLKSQIAAKLTPIQAPKVVYGKTETRRAISNVLGAVLHQYKYASLPELNAVLKLYNVVADPGTAGTRMYNNRGLVYRVLDEKGNKVGVPIKASAFSTHAKLTDLEKRFLENAPLKNAHKRRLQTSLRWIFNKRVGSLDQFVARLELQNISTVIRRGKEGVLYGITFVDHNTKCVFNGSDLGKEYAIKSILENCNINPPEVSAIPKKSVPSDHRSKDIKRTEVDDLHRRGAASAKIQPEPSLPSPPLDFVPYQLTRKRKRRKKRISP